MAITGRGGGFLVVVWEPPLSDSFFFLIELQTAIACAAGRDQQAARMHAETHTPGGAGDEWQA